jgi:hypothetical protein
VKPKYAVFKDALDAAMVKLDEYYKKTVVFSSASAPF